MFCVNLSDEIPKSSKIEKFCMSHMQTFKEILEKMTNSERKKRTLTVPPYMTLIPRKPTEVTSTGGAAQP